MSVATSSEDVLNLDSSTWSGDIQLVLVLDPNTDAELARLISFRQQDGAWRFYSFDLLGFAGRTVKLYFGTYNNGLLGITSMHVDDVTLEVCTPN
jgi:hypothetical protein